MILKNRKNLHTDSQSGVSLMLAILVLAAITAVAFSLATIVFIEIRSAGDSARTEPALYATLGVTEEALFQYKRYFDPDGEKQDMDVTSCTPEDETLIKNGTIYGICSLNGITLSMPPEGGQPIAFDNSPRVEFVGKGVTKVIPMYIANDFDKQYRFVQVDVLPNETFSPINVSFEVTQEDEIEPTVVAGGSVKPGVPYTYKGFSETGQYDMILENPANNEQDVSVSISTIRVGDAEPDGLPYVGEQVLRIMANYAGLTRTYQVRIPIP